MTQSTEQYFGIDVVKFLMALCVVAIHLPVYYLTDDPAGIYPPAFDWFIALGVPFFFACSGFLTAGRLDSIPEAGKGREAYLTSRAVRLLKILLYWNLIYLPLTVAECIHLEIPFRRAVAENFAALFTEGHSLASYVLWYVYALAITLGLLAQTCRRRWLTALLALAFALVTVGVRLYAGQMQQSAGGTLLFNFASTALGGGLFFFSGFYLSRMEIWRKSAPLWRKSAPLCLAVVALAASHYAFDHAIRFNRLIGGFALVCAALALSAFCRPSGASLLLRRLSMWVYFLHPMVLMFLFRCLKLDALCTPAVALTVAMAATTALAACALRLSDDYPKLKKLV